MEPVACHNDDYYQFYLLKPRINKQYNTGFSIVDKNRLYCMQRVFY